MKLFADTNWIVASYFVLDQESRHAVSQRFHARHEFPLHLCPAVFLECESVFASITRKPNSAEWTHFQSDLGQKIVLEALDWNEMIENSRSILHRFSHRARLGTFDMVILSSAVSVAATHFLSFDSNSNLRALASVLKLKVFPELTAEDRRRIQLFR